MPTGRCVSRSPPREAEAANRRLAHALGADLAATDAARILRPPHTNNFKHVPAAPVLLERLSDSRQTAAEIVAGLRDPRPWPRAVPSPARRCAATTRSVRSSPPSMSRPSPARGSGVTARSAAPSTRTLARAPTSTRDPRAAGTASPAAGGPRSTTWRAAVGAEHPRARLRRAAPSADRAAPALQLRHHGLSQKQAHISLPTARVARPERLAARPSGRRLGLRDLPSTHANHGRRDPRRRRAPAGGCGALALAHSEAGSGVYVVSLGDETDSLVAARAECPLSAAGLQQLLDCGPSYDSTAGDRTPRSSQLDWRRVGCQTRPSSTSG